MLRRHTCSFFQHKYEVVHHQLESTRTEIVECLNALQERLDNSRELEACLFGIMICSSATTKPCLSSKIGSPLWRHSWLPPLLLA
ncbi:hypothetical protein F444_11398 [Phytophthora nicotianae P1976]|uniref:Uncharacterized protein n=1 Tax=Phytophthora nicotianae P1976 TaxID=1317066 RepID=A0A081A0W2_PHYNI|nr:hypothetical protein F444_11398 [Phytophthora nicotianae P1976]